MNLKLVKPDKKYLPSIYEAIAEYKSAPSKYEISAVKKMIAAEKDNFADYFATIQKNSSGIGLNPGYVPNTIYWLVNNNQYIGTFDLRHYLTPNLEQTGGHIAYQIRPSAQRKGFAYNGLKLCLEKAHDMNIEQVLVTCDAENIASYGVMHKVMSEMGGYEDEPIKTDNLIEKRVWIKTHCPSDKDG